MEYASLITGALGQMGGQGGQKEQDQQGAQTQIGTLIHTNMPPEAGVAVPGQKGPSSTLDLSALLGMNAAQLNKQPQGLGGFAGLLR